MPSLTQSHLIRNRWIGTCASSPSRRPGTLATSPGRTARTGLGPPIISRFTSHLSLLPSPPPTEEEHIELFGFVPLPSNLHSILSPKLPHLSRSGVAFAAASPPISLGLVLAALSHQTPPPSARRFAGVSRRISQVLLHSRGSCCGFVSGYAAASFHFWRRGFSGRVWARSLEFVARLWVRSGRSGAVDLNCWFWVEESGRQVAILPPHFGRSPFWVPWGSHA